MLTTFTQIADGVKAGRRVAQRIQRYVSTSPGYLRNRFDHIGYLGSIHGGSGTQLASQIKRLFRNIDGHHVGTDGVGNHHGREANPTAAVDSHPLPCRCFALIHYRPK